MLVVPVEEDMQRTTKREELKWVETRTPIISQDWFKRNRHASKLEAKWGDETESFLSEEDWLVSAANESEVTAAITFTCKWYYMWMC